MKTELLTASAVDIDKAGNLLAEGGLVAIPTETVYGLAANAFDDAAVARIFAAKGRPQDNPLIVHVADKAAACALWREVPDAAHKLMDRFWPGPLTIVLPKAEHISAVVSAGLDTVAVRMPSNTVARAVIEAAGVPLAAPSANLSGKPSPTTAARVMEDMDGRIAAVVDGGDCDVGVESTVISLSGETPCLLRPGGITLFELRETIGDVKLHEAILKRHEFAAHDAVESPGMKYQHYAPKATVVLVDGDAAAFAAFVNGKAETENGVMALCFDDETAAVAVPYLTYGKRCDSAAHAKFAFEMLRRADDLGARQLYVACPAYRDNDLGMAVYNRLLRSAAFRVVTV